MPFHILHLHYIDVVWTVPPPSGIYVASVSVTYIVFYGIKTVFGMCFNGIYTGATPI